MSQIIYKYHTLGFKITPVPLKHTGNKIHDFDIKGYKSDYKCEVKTVQSMGQLERKTLGGTRLTEESHKSIISAIRSKLENAEKAGNSHLIK